MRGITPIKGQDITMRVSIDLDEDTFNDIRRLSAKYGLREEELLENIIKAITKYGLLEQAGNEYARGSLEELGSSLYRLVRYGKILAGFLRSADEWFGGLCRDGFDLEDMDVIEDNHGIVFRFVATTSSKSLFDEAIIQLQHNNDVYLSYSRALEVKEDRDLELGIINECVEEYVETGELEELEDEIEECSDFCEANLYVSEDTVDPGTAYLRVNLYLSGWECIPSIKTIDNVFRRILECVEMRGARKT